MAKGYILTDSDARILQRMKEFLDKQPVNTLPPDDVSSPVLAPEVYVARVPVNGIPPLSIGRRGRPDIPGSAVCDIYKIYLESSGRPVMIDVGFTRRVFNVSVAWIDSKYAIIKRDKFWAWVVDCPCTTETTGTATTGTGTTGTATTGTATTGTATTGTSTTGTGTTGTSTTGTATTGTGTTGTGTTGTGTTGTGTTGTGTTGTGTGTGTTGTGTTGTATATATATGTSTGSGTSTGTGSGNCVEVLKDVTVECVDGEIVVTKVFQTVMICSEEGGSSDGGETSATGDATYKWLPLPEGGEYSWQLDVNNCAFGHVPGPAPSDTGDPGGFHGDLRVVDCVPE